MSSESDGLQILEADAGEQARTRALWRDLWRKLLSDDNPEQIASDEAAAQAGQHKQVST